MRLVILHSEGREIAVNPDRVTFIQPAFGVYSTRVWFTGEEGDYVTVDEDFEFVVKRLLPQ